MDSKSVHRVAESLKVARHYDSKLKIWTIDGVTLSVDEIAKMSSLQLREKIIGKNGGTLSTTAKQMKAESSDGGTDVEKAADMLKKNSGDKVAKSIAENASNPKPKRARKAPKKSDADEGKEQVACVKVTFPAKKKAKRTAEDEKDMIWLPSVGISKWQTRQKMIARGNKEDARAWGKNKTQYLTPAEAKQFAKVVFDDVDKKVLAHPEKYTEKAVKYAKEALAAAEALLAAASK